MASVLLVTADPAHSLATTTETNLEARGHTVTVLDDENLASAVLTGVDVIASINARRAVTNTWLRDRWLAGYPLLLSAWDAELFGTTGGSSYQGVHVGADLGIFASTAANNYSAFINGTTGRTWGDVVTHPVNTGYAAGADVVIASANTEGVMLGSVPSGTVLGLRGPGGGSYGAAVEAGDAIINTSAVAAPGATAPTRLVWLGWLYPRTTTLVNSDGWTVVDNAVDWLAGSASPTVDVSVAAVTPAVTAAVSLDAVVTPRDLTLSAALPRVAATVTLREGEFTNTDLSLTATLPTVESLLTFDANTFLATPDEWNRGNGRTRDGIGYAAFTPNPTPIPPTLVASPIHVMAEQVKETP